MKTLALLLLAFTGFAQSASVHFYYSSANNAGAEIMFALRGTDSAYLGGGFSGALNQQSVTTGHINAYDLDQTVNRSFSEKWCSLYAVGSLGFLKSVLVKYRGGLAVYNRKVDFETVNGFKYSKIDKIEYKPLLGVSTMYALTQDVGLEAGFDTFNKVTLGVTILF